MKKGKHFYSHIIDTSSITLEIGNMKLSQEERVHLLSLTESNIHHAVLDAILSELSEDDKKKFMEHMHADNHDEIWKLLSSRINNVEERIKKAAEDLKKELSEDINKSK